MNTMVAAVGIGYALDLAWGDPRWLPHPVVVFGRVIATGERAWNRGTPRRRFWCGALLATGLVAATWAVTAGLVDVARRLGTPAEIAVLAAGVFYGLANRTLIEEGRAVFAALRSGLPEGRRRLARIVGRDTAELSPQQVRVATFETMAENLSDGVVAPLFYFAVAGLPGMMVYKMINTLDSMIGHHDDRHEWFGKAAARLDDAANLIPARLTAALMVLVTLSGRGARFVRRYGRAHASPNAGYPEAALAGIMDVRFGGPNRYGGEWVQKPWIGENPREIADGEFARVARVNHAVCALAVVLTAVVWLYRV
jgi:adenosylcobinamide-phosphate synthase